MLSAAVYVVCGYNFVAVYLRDKMVMKEKRDPIDIVKSGKKLHLTSCNIMCVQISVVVLTFSLLCADSNFNCDHFLLLGPLFDGVISF